MLVPGRGVIAGSSGAAESVDASRWSAENEQPAAVAVSSSRVTIPSPFAVVQI